MSATTDQVSDQFILLREDSDGNYHTDTESSRTIQCAVW